MAEVTSSFLRKKIDKIINLIFIIKERAKWGSSLEFILTVIGYAVGLGNVWLYYLIIYSTSFYSFVILGLAISVFGIQTWWCTFFDSVFYHDVSSRNSDVFFGDRCWSIFWIITFTCLCINGSFISRFNYK